MELVECYKALADESRLRILYCLRGGPLNVQELTQVVQMAQPTVSHHLKALERARMVVARKEGTWVYYGLNDEVSEGASGSGLHIGPVLLGGVKRFLQEKFLRGVELLDVRVDAAFEKRREKSREFFDSLTSLDSIKGVSGLGLVALDALKSAFPDEGILVDLGCGDGALLRALLPRAGKSLGIDYSEKMLALASRNLALGEDNEKPPLVELTVGRLENLPLEPNSVDVALLSMVLHHAARPQEVLEEVRRVLRPGGLCVILELARHADEVFKERRFDLWMGFDPEWLQRELGRLGFLVERVLEFKGELESFILVGRRGEALTKVSRQFAADGN